MRTGLPAWPHPTGAAFPSPAGGTVAPLPFRQLHGYWVSAEVASASRGAAGPGASLRTRMRYSFQNARRRPMAGGAENGPPRAAARGMGAVT